MSRYRAPLAPQSAFITPEGAARLRAELDELWRIRRPEVTRAVSEAAAQGDRSENAEYIYGKRQLREIDRRVRYLRKRIEAMTVVDRPPSDPAKIYFGAWVRVEDESGAELLFRIVGPDEIGNDRYISVDSPLGRALLGKGADAEVAIDLPQGRRSYVVTAVSYAPLP